MVNKQLIINDFNKLRLFIKRTPRVREDIRRYNPKLEQHIYKTWGSYTDFLDEIKVKHNNAIRFNFKKISEDDITKLIKEFYYKNGKISERNLCSLGFPFINLRSRIKKLGYTWNTLLEKLEIPRNAVYQKFGKPHTKNKNFYWFCGVLIGDGCVGINTIYLTTKDKEFRDKFKQVGFNVFGITPKYNIRYSTNPNHSDMYRCWFNNKGMCDYLKKLFNGKHNTKNWRVPRFVVNASKRNIGFFLKGFFDSEGFVSNNGITIEASSINKNGLIKIKKLVKKLGIDCYIKRKKLWILCINGSIKNRLLFKKYISFTIKRKQRRLLDRIKKDDIYNTYQICGYCNKKFFPSFKSPNQKYCSKECLYSHRNNVEYKKRRVKLGKNKCLWCKNIFLPIIGHQHQKYCSEKCMYTSKLNIVIKIRKNKRLKTITECHHCKNKFIPTKRINQKYCSIQCRYKEAYLRLKSAKDMISEQK